LTLDDEYESIWGSNAIYYVSEWGWEGGKITDARALVIVFSLWEALFNIKGKEVSERPEQALPE
jgi:hypothetical protein